MALEHEYIFFLPNKAYYEPLFFNQFCFDCSFYKVLLQVLLKGFFFYYYPTHDPTKLVFPELCLEMIMSKQVVTVIIITSENEQE